MLAAARLSRDGEVKFRFGIDNEWTPSDTDPSKPVKVKLTTCMLTPAGFLAVQLSTEQIGEVAKAKSQEKRYYLALSGGGWRAMSAHLGTFRVLGNTSALSMVNFLSSVSGGSWFLSKFMFDEDFASQVLSDDVLITDVSLKWFENSFFPEMQDVDKHIDATANQSALKSSVSKILSTAACPVQQSLGTVIHVTDRFGLSWQEMVESSVLGKHIANRTLATANVTPATRTKLGKQFTASFNWNQMHRWEDNNSQWYVKTKRKGEKDKHAQYPLYTSALYTPLENGENQVEIRAQGKLMTELLTVCHQKKVDARTDTVSIKKVHNMDRNISDDMPNFSGHYTECCHCGICCSDHKGCILVSRGVGTGFSS